MSDCLKLVWNHLQRIPQQTVINFKYLVTLLSESVNLFKPATYLLIFYGMVLVYFQTSHIRFLEKGKYRKVLSKFPMSFNVQGHQIFDQKDVTAFESKDIKAIYKQMIMLRALDHDNYLSQNSSQDAKGERYKTSLHSLEETIHFEVVEALVEKEIEKNAQELNNLSELVQKRLFELQNPTQCATERKLLCLVQSKCGFGCTIHYYATCMFIAIGTNRTMIPVFSGIRYEDIGDIFQPISGTCGIIPDSDLVEWRGEASVNPTSNSIPAVKITFHGFVRNHQTLLSGHAIPAEIASRLNRLHTDPSTWWIGQIMRYLLKVTPSAAERIKEVKDDIGFTHPIVGVHVRRTDKLGREAEYHKEEEYMFEVNNWYDRYDKKIGTNTTRRIYLATDQPKVLEEMKKKYPTYVILSDPSMTPERAFFNRYWNGSLMGVVVDIKLLSECDFFVGTFSSNVGRTVHELMQSEGEKTFQTCSIDTSYHFPRAFWKRQKAIENHEPLKGEIELLVGDLINVHYCGKLCRSYQAYGENTRTKKKGKYPLYKVENVLLTAPYHGII